MGHFYVIISIRFATVSNCWLNAAQELCLRWPEIRQQLTTELALECCCILTALKEHEVVQKAYGTLSSLEKEQLKTIQGELTIIVNDYHVDIEWLYQRSREILGILQK